MPFTASRTHPAFSGAAAAAVAALTVVAIPAEAHGATGDCDGPRFTATAQADLAKISVLDAGVLRPDLPALADVRLASAHGSADSGRRPDRTIATGRYADAKLLGLRVPGVPLAGTVAESRAPSGKDTAVEARNTVAGLDAGGLATIRLGKSTADSSWDDAYGCGKAGPLTRSATMLAGAQFLGGGGTIPALLARGPAGAAQPTSLLRIGPTGSTQSATDLVREKGRRAVRSAAGVALSEVTLFAGTPQEVSVKVVTQPTLTVTATGSRAGAKVDYRPAVLKVTAAGKPVATLDTGDDSVGVDLFGGVGTASLLSARISLGGPRQTITDYSVRAEAAAVRVEVMLGKAHLLDVALGYLYAQASTPPLNDATRAPSAVATTEPAVDVTEPAVDETEPAVDETEPAVEVTEPAVEVTPQPPVEAIKPVAEAEPRDESALALTGANIAAAATGGLLLIALGVAAVAMTRRRRH
ncbi:hypothetical protein KOI35_32920 [Actinoplanes bogorensis]|uniref:Gram-positive cocci surface proteins LPxTG domain-containing protein n=1 Tax=Paractinoplanes bogorensis TaxID=1610840 RepID=A0ABS5YYD2_9ACTN|nr:hypothetical protein [Actinoplanes bogorensis]MBU2668326.1 hypothetical protein [Actinoplanes bogorensis]